MPMQHRQNISFTIRETFITQKVILVKSIFQGHNYMFGGRNETPLAKFDYCYSIHVHVQSITNYCIINRPIFKNILKASIHSFLLFLHNSTHANLKRHLRSCFQYNKTYFYKAENKE